MRLADAPYRGWTNFETFSIYDALQKDEKLSKQLNRYLHRVIDYDYTMAETRRILMAGVKDIYSINFPKVREPYSSLIRHAAESINWREVADRIISENPYLGDRT